MEIKNNKEIVTVLSCNRAILFTNLLRGQIHFSVIMVIVLLKTYLVFAWTFLVVLLPRILKLFGIPIFGLQAFLLKAIPEMCRAHYI